MIRTMLVRHKLAALIWAAAFVVAAQFFAGAALAHAGHPHHHHSAAVHASADQTHQNGAASDEAQPQKSRATFAAATLPDHVACAPSGCAGGCCGAGIGCCGAALAGNPSALPDMPPVKDTAAVVLVRRSGIDPEALARPPRPLA